MSGRLNPPVITRAIPLEDLATGAFGPQLRVMAASSMPGAVVTVCLDQATALRLGSYLERAAGFGEALAAADAQLAESTALLSAADAALDAGREERDEARAAADKVVAAVMAHANKVMRGLWWIAGAAVLGWLLVLALVVTR
jgi:hypothetical protein